MLNNRNQRVAALHDLSGFGRSSLTIVSPVLTTMGIQVCPLPTAILSTQTSGFDGYYFVDFTEHLQPIIDHWKREKLTFEGIYTGFLGSSSQVTIVNGFIRDFKKEDSLIVVDPVMGDQGKLYGPYTDELVSAMGELTGSADIITPNYTEAAFLLGEDPLGPPPDRNTLKQWMRGLSENGPKRVIITSVPGKSSDPRAIIVAYDRDFDQYWQTETEWLPAVYPGTGDMFASVVTGALLQGDSLPTSMDRAVGFILHAIRSTYALKLPEREGVLLERALPVLSQPAVCKTKELL